MDGVKGYQIATEVQSAFAAVYPHSLSGQKLSIETYICGGIRRGNKEVHDVDLMYVATEAILPEVVCTFHQNFGEVTGGQKVVFFTWRGEQVEVRFCTYDHAGAMLLYLTGNSDFNRAMRTLAKKRNLLLNQYGINNRETFESLTTGEKEDDIFRVLGMDYIEPKLRHEPMILDMVWGMQ